MVSTKHDVLKAALALSLEDRLDVADALLAESMPPDDFELDDAWKEEITRRAKELDDGVVKGISLDEFCREAQDIIDRGA